MKDEKGANPVHPSSFILHPSLGLLMAQILDGKALAQTMQAEIATRVAEFTRKHELRPGLAAIIVGDSPASQVYVRNKRSACEKVGMASRLHQLPEDTSEEDLLKL